MLYGSSSWNDLEASDRRKDLLLRSPLLSQDETVSSLQECYGTNSDSMLWGSEKRIEKWQTLRDRVEPCCYSKLWQDTWLLLHQYDCAKYSALLDSRESKDKDLTGDLPGQRRNSLTRLIINASARDSAPSFLIWLLSRSNNVRVFEENERMLDVVVGCLILLDWPSKHQQGDEHLHGPPRCSKSSIRWVSVNSALCETEKREMLSDLIVLQRVTEKHHSLIANTVGSKRE